jgi:hypothetical protein
VKDYDNGQILVASCFAFSDPRCVQFFNNLGEALAERRIQLVALSTRDTPGLEFPQLQIPYSLLGFDKLVQLPGLSPIHAIAPLANAERAWSGAVAGPDTWARATAKCEWLYQVIAEELAPCGALLWNATHPNSRIGRNILQGNDIPTWCLERGQLAGTYQVQVGEVNDWDDSLAAFSMHAGLAGDLARQTDDAFHAARAFSLAGPVDRHVIQDSGQHLPERRGPVILVLTSALGSSIEPDIVRSVNLSQPPWGGLQATVDALDALLPADATILFRDHPINRTVIEAPLRLPARFIEANGMPIADLIDYADRVACIGTTTLQYEALLRDKPLLLVGRSLAGRAGAAYVASGAGHAREVIAAWMDDSEGELRRAKARALVGLLCERMLVRESDQLSHVANGVADLADFIAAQAISGSQPVADRIERFTSRFIEGCTSGDPIA